MAAFNFEQQRKLAKDLKRAHQQRSAGAAARISKFLPRARSQSIQDVLQTPLTLSEAQHVVAKEAGFASWPAMKRGTSIALAAERADVKAVLSLLEAEPNLATQRTGPNDWPPLLYLCCSRYRPRELSSERVTIANRLIELGADVNVQGLDTGWTAPNVTQIFDEHEWRPIEGAAGRVVSAKLVQTLLEAGADLRRTTQVLAQAVSGGNVDILKMLLAVAPRDWWQMRWALKACVVMDRTDMAQLIVDATRGQNPSQVAPDRAIEEALRLERDANMIEVLLDGALAEPMPRQAYRGAIRFGRADVAELLRIDETAATLVDRAIGASVQGLPTEPVHEELHGEDHRMLSWAIRRKRYAAVPLLLQLGLDPNVPDVDGETPLHLAVQQGATHIVELLMQAGASPTARNFEGQRAVDVAKPPRDRKLDDLFEQAADAVAFGQLQKLKELLDAEPGLVHARSPRPHRATLLHYCGANGTEDPRQQSPANAAAVAQLLLERGADPNATCNLYGGGATTIGLLLTSVHPRAAAVDGQLVEVLARFGARLHSGHLANAIEYGAPLAARALAEAGIPIDSLYLAAGLDDIGRMEQLLANGADINARRSAGTPLHAAAAMGHRRAAEWLLDRGADTTVRNVWSSTPAGTARYFGHTDLADLISSRAAASASE